MKLSDRVYAAMADAYDEALNRSLGNPPGSVGLGAMRDHPAFRAATRAAAKAALEQLSTMVRQGPDTSMWNIGTPPWFEGHASEITRGEEEDAATGGRGTAHQDA